MDWWWVEADLLGIERFRSKRKEEYLRYLCEWEAYYFRIRWKESSCAFVAGEDLDGIKNFDEDRTNRIFLFLF